MAKALDKRPTPLELEDGRLAAPPSESGIDSRSAELNLAAAVALRSAHYAPEIPEGTDLETETFQGKQKAIPHDDSSPPPIISLLDLDR